MRRPPRSGIVPSPHQEATPCRTTPFALRYPATDEELDDLAGGAATLADKETVDDWTQGIPLSYVQEVCAYWAENTTGATEKRLNASAVHHEIDGLESTSFMWSPEANAKPLLSLTGGGSIVEFHKVIGR